MRSMNEMTEELIDIVLEHGNDGRLDIEDMNLAWTYWDDNDTTHFDEDGYIDRFVSLSVGMDCNDCQVLFVETFNGKTFNFDNPHYEDWEECQEYIHSEVYAEY